MQLEALFGLKFPQKIQALVDAELNEGRWVDGYEVAVTDGVVTGEEARELLRVALDQQSELRIDPERLRAEVAQHLPQSSFSDLEWIVADGGSYGLTDRLRVARFDGDSLAWVTPRISWDGIEFDSLSGGEIRGRAWHLSDSVRPDDPFVLDFETGELKRGTIVGH